jgi:hypothetical protein
LGAFLFFSCPHEPDKTVEPSRLVHAGIPVDLMGMVHAGERSEVDTEYTLLDKLGVEWMLTDFSWGSIEPSEGDWNLDAFKTYADNGQAHHKKILALLDYDVGWIHDGTHSDDPFTDGAGHKYIAVSEIPYFVKYVKETVTHYKDRVDAWCIWNEPNLSDRFWRGTPEEFFALTKAAAAAIREVDPGAFIIGGAFNTTASEDWFRGIFTSGAMDNIDAIAYHPYMIGPGPTANAYTNFQKIVSEYGFGDKIWVTEVGYPTYDGPSRPAGRYGTDVQAANMPETVMLTITLLTVNGAQRIFWYHLFDPVPASQDNGDSEDWFGLVNHDFTPKPGAAAYRLAAKHIPGTVCKTPGRDGLSNVIQAYYFEGQNRHALIVWNEINTPKEVRVYLPGTNQQVYDLTTGDPRAIAETSTYTLKSKDGVNHFIQFFTWENSSPSPTPRISAP